MKGRSLLYVGKRPDNYKLIILTSQKGFTRPVWPRPEIVSS
jgi:hypothetical protein